MLLSGIVALGAGCASPQLQTYVPATRQFSTRSGTLLCEPPRGAPSDEKHTRDLAVSALRPRFRACYKRYLRAVTSFDPISGAVCLSADVLASGVVSRVDAFSSFPDPIVHCVLSALGHARFPASSVSRRVQIPLKFVLTPEP